MSNEYLFTSESVTEGHPDKICDQISDAILDALIARELELEQESKGSKHPTSVKNLRCACETLVTTGSVIVAGEIRTQGYVDVQAIVRRVLKDIGYDRAKYGFDCETCGILNSIHDQSGDIAQGVDESYEAQHQGALADCDILNTLGAGDQGMMFGYACNETPSLMPLPIYAAHRLSEELTRLRKDQVLPYLRPDGKTQVTVRYVDDKPVCIEKILVSTQHAEEVSAEQLREDIIEKLIYPTCEREGLELSPELEIYVNPTGRFVIGGPMGDTGLTGRKIIVDTYGGAGRHGGGAFSGKDCTKVDRSGAYAARWVAKNIVAATLASKCEVQVAYAIGVAHPLSLSINTFGTHTVDEELIRAAVEQVFDLRPAAIIRDLKLWRPIYEQTARYGHFGREKEEFTWEHCNKVDELRQAIASL